MRKIMHKKRNLFFILTLVLIILSMSFASASEDLAVGDGNSTLTATSDIVVDEIDEENLVEESSGLDVGLIDNQSDANKKVNGLRKNSEVLGASNNGIILGAPQQENLYGGTPQQIMDKIKYLGTNGGGILYLNNATYVDYYQEWWGSGYRTGSIQAGTNEILEIKDVKVYGGTPDKPYLMSTFVSNGYCLNFDGVHHTYYNNGQWVDNWRETYGTSGCKLVNVSFENINATLGGVVSFASGSVINCTINNCYSRTQFMGMQGSCMDNTPIHIWGCNFTNCHQTYPGENGVNDGSGQLGAVFGIDMRDCKFENTSSAQHGGALCIADESEWGSGNVTSTITNTKFINVTSRWFAVYIHGNFSTSIKWIKDPQIIDGCEFINCTGTGEYSAGIGISHDNLIVRNSKFINNIGGQGSAIMVGGLDGAHDGFSGRNYQGNNVTIENCTFMNNIAKIENQTSSFCVEIYKNYEENKDKYKGEPRFNLVNGVYVPDDNGAYYQKHANVTFYPSGDAGAVYIYGNDTKIIDCIFDGNRAHSGNGSAMYIVGNRTIISVR